MLVALCIDLSYSLIFESDDSRQMRQMLKEYKCKHDAIGAAAKNVPSVAGDWKELQDVFNSNYACAQKEQVKERISSSSEYVEDRLDSISFIKFTENNPFEFSLVQTHPRRQQMFLRNSIEGKRIH